MDKSRFIVASLPILAVAGVLTGSFYFAPSTKDLNAAAQEMLGKAATKNGVAAMKTETAVYNDKKQKIGVITPTSLAYYPEREGTELCVNYSYAAKGDRFGLADISNSVCGIAPRL